MRHILVDHARELCRGKRGSGAQLLPLEEGPAFSTQKSLALVAQDDWLERSLGVHPNTVIREVLAKAWLKRALGLKVTHAD